MNNGVLNLKKNNNYYFQVQGQLRTTGRKYCYFVVWTPLGLIYDKIERYIEFWDKHMVNKLTAFYLNYILPELLDPRYPLQLPIRD